ncbi:unnamed protein product [Mycena citricolor]|uniref:peptide-methionine (S)-S-oxide reductase n=1 Tax=Mycena citricolor TaxID=2018698 RepID=A0AAD2GXR4_9AGAR|nr:unnamed protein product [Mycena citricolor]
MGVMDHAEAAKLEYDTDVVSYAEPDDFFYRTHDPPTIDRQGGDMGTQYRSAIFTTTPDQQTDAQRVMEEVQAKHFTRKGLKIVMQILPAGPWWDAEDYHQLPRTKRGHCADSGNRAKGERVGKLRPGGLMTQNIPGLIAFLVSSFIFGDAFGMVSSSSDNVKVSTDSRASLYNSQTAASKESEAEDASLTDLALKHPWFLRILFAKHKVLKNFEGYVDRMADDILNGYEKQDTCMMSSLISSLARHPAGEFRSSNAEVLSQGRVEM